MLFKHLVFSTYGFFISTYIVQTFNVKPHLKPSYDANKVRAFQNNGATVPLHEN